MDERSPDPEAGPPPAPGTRWEGTPDLPSVGEDRTRSRRGRRSVTRALGLGLVGVLLAGGGFVGGLAASDRMTVPEALRDRAVADAEREADLIALLEDVVRTERVMLAFNDEVSRGLEGLQDEVSARAAIAGAAARGVGGLTALRPSIVERPAGGRVEGVREAYVPHLDAWIEYLEALSEQPDLLFAQAEQQPYLLLINATAEDFGGVLEELVRSGPVDRVAELAERILDDGFRSEGADPQV